MPPERSIRRLSQRLRGVALRSEAYYRIVYARDAAGRSGRAAAVAFPRSLEDLARLVREAGQAGVPLVMRGAGTGFSGGAVPVEGGIVVSTEKLSRILGFDPEAGWVEVEAGLVNGRLQEYLERRGFFYPPDPASFRVSTIGGNIAENAGGPRAYKYGVTRRYVRALVWVDAGGAVHETALEGPAALLPGAEGTLGAIYSARLGVLPKPDVCCTALIAAGRGGEALGVGGEMLSAGVMPSVLEFIDEKTMRCVSEYRRLPAFGSGGGCLFVEIDGCGGEVAMQRGLLESFCRARRLECFAARDAARREMLWELRRAVSPSLARRGITKVNEDVSLPLGRLAEAVDWIHAAALELDLDCYVFGHCGDGNLHVNIMTDRRRSEEMRRAEGFVERLFEYVARAGGTLSGEHGIGITKRDYLGMIFSPAEIELQGRLRQALDPAGVFSPGAYFAPPPQRGA